MRPTLLKRILFFVSADTILFFVSLHFAYALRFDFEIPPEHMANFYHVFITLSLLKLLFLTLLGVYHLTWRFFGFSDLRSLWYAHIGAFIAFFALFWWNSPFFLPMPRSVIGIDLPVSLMLLGALRASKRLVLEQSRYETYHPALLLGISSHSAHLIESLRNQHHRFYGIIALQTKNYSLIGSSIHGVKVYGVEALGRLLDEHTITHAILDGTLPQEELRDAYTLLHNAHVHHIRRVALLGDDTQLRPLSIEELLARHPKDLDRTTIAHFLHNKIIAITGAGGSIGSEIALQCHQFGAKHLILIDHSEYNLYQIGEELPDATLHLGSILDRDAMDRLWHNHHPDILIHAAAYKHVPLCEANPHVAIENNVYGSITLLDSAIAASIPKIVIISTDKAVRPTNIMGTTKRIVELYAQNVVSHRSEIVAVRFGNVLGSSGSVIPKFRKQIEEGGPITLTHPDITRYFMLIDEACQLVLQAAAIARGGELFILDMGEPVKIADLAHTMISLYATRPIDIVYTGLRPGEKLYEELLIDEHEQKTSYASILIAKATPYPIETLRNDIALLRTSDSLYSALQKIVPEFTPQG